MINERRSPNCITRTRSSPRTSSLPVLFFISVVPSVPIPSVFSGRSMASRVPLPITFFEPCTMLPMMPTYFGERARARMTREAKCPPRSRYTSPQSGAEGTALGRVPRERKADGSSQGFPFSLLPCSLVTPRDESLALNGTVKGGVACGQEGLRAGCRTRPPERGGPQPSGRASSRRRPVIGWLPAPPGSWRCRAQKSHDRPKLVLALREPLLAPANPDRRSSASRAVSSLSGFAGARAR
ncbi:hypothetical protein CALCODRAFT_348427 [Calocera cornea HHB12733]|uniref:Uncharacterized protein n=1 Tax=Calocera cornea HHB12733 TaxID=1353952 RepID=A0A165JD69_9BASI|nr:hypothetical protein CALCODRAFT_348427 [Calocera cornea HHB12733]